MRRLAVLLKTHTVLAAAPELSEPQAITVLKHHLGGSSISDIHAATRYPKWIIHKTLYDFARTVGALPAIPRATRTADTFTAAEKKTIGRLYSARHTVQSLANRYHTTNSTILALVHGSEKPRTRRLKWLDRKTKGG